jgi:hypothetical protein
MRTLPALRAEALAGRPTVNAVQIRSFCGLACGPVDSEGVPPSWRVPVTAAGSVRGTTGVGVPGSRRSARWVMGGLDFRQHRAHHPIYGRYSYMG